LGEHRAEMDLGSHHLWDVHTLTCLHDMKAWIIHLKDHHFALAKLDAGAPSFCDGDLSHLIG
jgi:hypothetical protein